MMSYKIYALFKVNKKFLINLLLLVSKQVLEINLSQFLNWDFYNILRIFIYFQNEFNVVLI